MAFDINSFNNVTSGAAKGNRLWSYNSSTDTLATVVADDYFLTVTNSLTANDLIYVVASNGTGWFFVNSATSSTVTLGSSEGAAHVKVDITSAEVLALRATPKELVAAPGANKILVFESILLQVNYNSAAYTESSDNMAVRYTNGSGVIVSSTIEATGFVDATADASVRGVAITDAIVANSAAENKALVLHNTGDGEYASGNSPLVADVFYRVVNGV